MGAGSKAATSGGAGHASAVTAALRAYADRGVFRGFTATPLAGDRTAYEFHWLLRPRMRAVFDARAGTLTFPAIAPGVDRSSPMVTGLDAIVASRTGRALPAHKRLDARRARVSATVQRGGWSLVVAIRGGNHAYAVQRSLNLINELFLFLHESHPEYLIERFGLSAE